MQNNSSIVERFSNAFACPLEHQISVLREEWRCYVFELWYGILCSHLPDRHVADSLRGDFAEMLSAPNAESIERLCEDDATLERITWDVVHSRSDRKHLWKGSAEVQREFSFGTGSLVSIDAPRLSVWLDRKFDELAGWIGRFRIVSRHQRTKHWPSSSNLSSELFLKESSARQDEGLLLPPIEAGHLRATCLDALMYLIYAELRDLEVSPFPHERVEQFRHAWSRLAERGAFRLALRVEIPIGAYNGIWAQWLICDVDTKSAIGHCYPGLEPPDDSIMQIQDEGIGPLPEIGGRYFNTFREVAPD